MLPCETPISCSRSSERAVPTLTLKKTFRQEALNKSGEVAPETKIPEVRQNALLLRCVVGLLRVKENS